MNDSITKACAVYGLHESLIGMKGNYPRKVRVYAMILHHELATGMNPDYSMPELWNDANFFGLNPEESSYDSLRQRLYAFDSDNLAVLPIGSMTNKFMQHMTIMAEKSNTDVATVWFSKKRLYQAFRLKMLAYDSETVSKETYKYIALGLDSRLG